MPDSATIGLSELAAFVKVVQAGSFTAAARDLGVEKARVSRNVARLERRLGARLLERTTRAQSLTEVGREIFERAVGILGAVKDVENVAQQLHGEPRGILRLTCGVEFGSIAVAGWIGEYLERHPSVGIDADYTNRVVDIVHEGFDVAIRVGALQDSRLAARRIGELRYGLFASAGYLRRHGTPTAPERLSGHALLMFVAGSHGEGWHLERGEERRFIEGPARLRVNNSFSIRDAAIGGLGIAQLPLRVAEPALRARTLRRVLPEWSPPPVPVHAVFPSNRYLTPKVRAFVDLAVQRFAG